MLRKIGASLAAAVLLVLCIFGHASAATAPRVVITEIKLGGAVAGQPTEYAELFNDSDQVVDVGGWLLEYAKPAATLTPADCAAPNWQTIAGTSNVKNTELQGTIQPHGRVTVELGLNDNVGGSLRLLQVLPDDQPPVIYDLVGWGNGTSSNAPCKEGTNQAPLPANGTSIKRLFDGSGHPVDTNQNAADFTQSSPDPDPSTDPSPTDSPPPAGCVGIELSEILANPAGSDTGHEYIELHNTTDVPQSLDGCVLKTNSNSKTYAVPADIVLQPNEYRAFTSDITGLTLVNSGGEATLTTPVADQVVQYPLVGDDEAWALIAGSWQITLQPTPNQPNLAVSDIEPVTAASESTLAPCPAGKYRNPDTNRCRTIQAADVELQPCDIGQERNSATNRCRKIASLTVATPCQAGYERNPDTNRCRKVTTASSTLKPCAAGQERNPDTNRCRKVTQGVKAASIADDGQAAKSKINYIILAVIFCLIGGYVVYEYRTDIVNYAHRFWLRVRPKNVPK